MESPPEIIGEGPPLPAESATRLMGKFERLCRQHFERDDEEMTDLAIGPTSGARHDEQTGTVVLPVQTVGPNAKELERRRLSAERRLRRIRLASRAVRTHVQAPRRAESSGKPAARRTAASSSTSSADPGDPDPPPQPPLCVRCGKRPVHPESGERQCCVDCWIAPPSPDELDDELDPEVAEIRKAVLWEPRTLRDAFYNESPGVEPVPGTAGLLYREQAAEFFSERGNGKSIALAVVLASAAHHGEKVLILDRENGGNPVADRFRDIFAAHPEWRHVLDDGSLDARFFPTLDSEWDGEDFAEALEGFTVVALDSSREFIGQLGGNTNSDDDWTRLCNLAVTPLRQRGVAVAITDNVGHTETHRPKGAGAKLDAIPTAYRLKAAEKFNQTKLGEIEFTCTRSRFGDEGRKWTMRIGDGVFDMPVPASDSPADGVRRRREEFRQACVAALTDNAPLGRNALITEARKHGAKGRETTLRELLSDLASDHASGIVHDGQDGYSLGVVPEAGPPPDHPPATRGGPAPAYKAGGPPGGPEPGTPLGPPRVDKEKADTTNGHVLLADLSDSELLAAGGPGATLEDDSGVAS